jgi:antitoxin ParD1/3/4
MDIQLPPQIEGYIASKIANGEFADASSFLSAIAEKFKSEEQKIKALRQAIKIGDDQIKAGEVVPYNMDLIEEITKEAIENHRLGKGISPDVMP